MDIMFVRVRVRVRMGLGGGGKSGNLKSGEARVYMCGVEVDAT